MRRLLLFGAGGLIALLVVAFLARGPLATSVMGLLASRVVGADPIGALPDGLTVTLCGAGSPLPDPRRSGPCVGIVAGGTLFVVDAGAAAARNMQRMGLPPDRTAASIWQPVIPTLRRAAAPSGACTSTAVSAAGDRSDWRTRSWPA